MKRAICCIVLAAGCAKAQTQPLFTIGYLAQKESCLFWSNDVRIAARFKQQGMSFNQVQEQIKDTHFAKKAEETFLDAAYFVYFDPRVKMLEPERAEQVGYETCMAKTANSH